VIIKRAYKTELKLNDKQRTVCIKHAGTSRFAYNWGLARRIEAYKKEGKTLNAMALHRELNRLKKTDYFWMYEVSKCSPQEALRDLDKAFKKFFEHHAKYPRFKSKKKGIGSFRLTGTIKVSNNAVQLPRLGELKLKEKGYLPTNTHILSATVSEHAGRWFVSIQVEEDIEIPENNNPIVGVDIGINSMAKASDETVFQNPRALRRYERKIKKIQREVSRKQKKSNNRKKAVRKLQRAYKHVEDIRTDAIHKTTIWLARNKSVIVVEDLNVSGMLKNHCLSKAISDVGMGEFRRQLEYKTLWNGSKLIVADRFYPSSKTCSVCGYVKNDLKLSDRMFICDNCHSQIDRDYNASVNLERLAVSCTESINACGEATSGYISDGVVKPALMKQEMNTIKEMS
jgi:putative transposase